MKARREFRLAGGAGNDDASRLQGFAQYLQYPPVEFGQFVEEQHAAMGEGDLAGPRLRTAAHQGYRRGGVMGRAERPRAPLRGDETLVADGGDGRGLQGFGFGHGGEDGGQAAGEHGLAGAGRTDHQQVVTARGGDLQRAFGVVLAAYFGEITIVVGGRRRGAGSMGINVFRAAQVFADFQKMGCAQDGGVAHQGGLVGIDLGQQQAASGVAAMQRGDECAADAAQFAGEGQFTDEFVVGQGCRRDLSRGGEYP